MKSPKTTKPVSVNVLAPKAASPLVARPFHAPQDHEREEEKEIKTGLPDQLKAGVETLSGLSLDDVRVHYNSDQPAGVGASAYAQGSQIHVGPGQENTLPHETWHVVQQKQGRVKPTLQMNGNVNMNDEANLEKEADVMGGRANQRTVHQQNEERAPACGCPACRHVQKVKTDHQSDGHSTKIKSISSLQNSQKPIQRCVKCRDASCKNGEKCGFDPTYGGLFSSKETTRHVGPHKQTKKSSQRGQWESEHPLAKEALKQSGASFRYEDEFTIRTPYSVHRGGQSGAGGGISSTGSSSTAKGWASHMADQLATDPKSAIRLAALEQINSYIMQKQLDNEALNAVVRWIDGQATDRRISTNDAREIQNEMISYAFDHMS